MAIIKSFSSKEGRKTTVTGQDSGSGKATTVSRTITKKSISGTSKRDGDKSSSSGYRWTPGSKTPFEQLQDPTSAWSRRQQAAISQPLLVSTIINRPKEVRKLIDKFGLDWHKTISAEELFRRQHALEQGPIYQALGDTYKRETTTTMPADVIHGHNVYDEFTRRTGGQQFIIWEETSDGWRIRENPKLASYEGRIETGLSEGHREYLRGLLLPKGWTEENGVFIYTKGTKPTISTAPAWQPDFRQRQAIEQYDKDLALAEHKEALYSEPLMEIKGTPERWLPFQTPVGWSPPSGETKRLVESYISEGYTGEGSNISNHFLRRRKIIENRQKILLDEADRINRIDNIEEFDKEYTRFQEIYRFHATEIDQLNTDILHTNQRLEEEAINLKVNPPKMKGIFAETTQWVKDRLDETHEAALKLNRKRIITSTKDMPYASLDPIQVSGITGTMTGFGGWLKSTGELAQASSDWLTTRGPEGVHRDIIETSLAAARQYDEYMATKPGPEKLGADALRVSGEAGGNILQWVKENPEQAGVELLLIALPGAAVSRLRKASAAAGYGEKALLARKLLPYAQAVEAANIARIRGMDIRNVAMRVQEGKLGTGLAESFGLEASLGAAGRLGRTGGTLRTARGVGDPVFPFAGYKVAGGELGFRAAHLAGTLPTKALMGTEFTGSYKGKPILPAGDINQAIANAIANNPRLRDNTVFGGSLGAAMAKGLTQGELIRFGETRPRDVDAYSDIPRRQWLSEVSEQIMKDTGKRYSTDEISRNVDFHDLTRLQSSTWVHYEGTGKSYRVRSLPEQLGRKITTTFTPSTEMFRTFGFNNMASGKTKVSEWSRVKGMNPDSIFRLDLRKDAIDMSEIMGARSPDEIRRYMKGSEPLLGSPLNFTEWSYIYDPVSMSKRAQIAGNQTPHSFIRTGMVSKSTENYSLYLAKSRTATSPQARIKAHIDYLQSEGKGGDVTNAYKSSKGDLSRLESELSKATEDHTSSNRIQERYNAELEKVRKLQEPGEFVPDNMKKIYGDWTDRGRYASPYIQTPSTDIYGGAYPQPPPSETFYNIQPIRYPERPIYTPPIPGAPPPDAPYPGVDLPEFTPYQYDPPPEEPITPGPPPKEGEPPIFIPPEIIPVPGVGGAPKTKRIGKRAISDTTKGQEGYKVLLYRQRDNRRYPVPGMWLEEAEAFSAGGALIDETSFNEFTIEKTEDEPLNPKVRFTEYHKMKASRRGRGLKEKFRYRADKPKEIAYRRNMNLMGLLRDMR